MKRNTRIEAVAMAYFKDALSRWTNDPSIDCQSGAASPDESPLNTKAIARLPIPLRNGRVAALHDTGVEGTVLPERLVTVEEDANTDAQRTPTVDEDCEPYVHLNRLLLVRFNLPRPNGETARVLCVTEDIQHTGLKLRLPCKLGLRPGMVVATQLFISPQDPVTVKTVVRTVSRTAGGDVVRYVVEMRFKDLSAAAEHEINTFVRAAQTNERQTMLA